MDWFNNLRIRQRLGLGFGIVLALMVGLSAFSLKQLAEVNGATVDLATSRMPSVEALANIRFDTVTLKRRELNLLLADGKDIDSWKEQTNAVDMRLAEEFKRYEPLISSDEERQLYEEYRADLARYESAHTEVVKLAENHKHREAVELSQKDGRVSMDAAVEKLGEDMRLNVRGGEAAARNAAAAYAVRQRWVAGMLTAAFGIGIFSELST
ncbi:MAG: MCP four helix bundle domain-containing protein [Candidatus Sulfotelmatobacter sp.]